MRLTQEQALAEKAASVRSAAKLIRNVKWSALTLYRDDPEKIVEYLASVVDDLADNLDGGTKDERSTGTT